MNKDRLYTDARVDITGRVESGKTKLFADQKVAEEYAKQKRSYVYWAYNKDGYFYCYAVPK